MPTQGYGKPCDFKGSPYIGDCGYDAAFEAMLTGAPGMVRGKPSDTVAANLRVFDQAPFFAGLPAAVSMAATGFVYVPTRCHGVAATRPCKLHVAFHGCQQGVDTLGDVFATHAGYNGHAERNDIVVLYPNARAGQVPFNPKGCFDWWGYTTPAYASSLGAQVAGVKNMVERLAAVRPGPAQQRDTT